MVNAIDLIGLQFQPFFKTPTAFSSTGNFLANT
jgi:hypothetical protein